MHPASNSVKVFGLYAIATGIGLVFAPGLVLAPLGIAVPTEIWIRVVGALAAPLGYYYWFAARRMWWSFSVPAFAAAFCSPQSWSCWSRSTQRQCRYFCLPPSMSRARFGPLTACASLRVREPHRV